MTSHDSSPHVDRRTRRFAFLMAVPALVVAFVLCGIEIWRAAEPGSALFMPPAVASLAEAIEQNDLFQASQFIRRGQPPDELIAVRHATLTGGRWVLTSPLMWATALKNAQAVQMLLAFGASADRAVNRSVVCLAEAQGDEQTVHVIEAFGRTATRRECGDIATGEAPLLRLSNEAR
jgi:hypothetical protein